MGRRRAAREGGGRVTPDDEAFVRAILAAPGDDLPRLVYADWLDDRDDPRGAYLRAEAVWATPWKDGICPADDPRLRAMAAGLDSVWVGRVSRPPVGVCCDHIWLDPIQDGDPFDCIKGTEVDQLELELGHLMPTNFRAFLLNYNGGFPEPGSLSKNEEALEHMGYPEDERVEIEAFAALRNNRRREYHGNIARPALRLRFRDERSNRDYGRLPGIHIAYSHVVVFSLPLASPIAGRVFGQNDDWKLDGFMYEVAPDFARFLTMIRTDCAPWERHILRGNTTAFRTCLDAVGHPSMLKGKWRQSALSRAVFDGRSEIVELLLKRGAQPSWPVWEHAMTHTNEQIRVAISRYFPQKPASDHL